MENSSKAWSINDLLDEPKNKTLVQVLMLAAKEVAMRECVQDDRTALEEMVLLFNDELKKTY